MKLRNTLIAAALALVVVAVILRFVASAHNKHGCEGPRPCGWATEDWQQAIPEATEADRRGVYEATDGGFAEDSARPDTPLLDPDSERSIVRDGSFDFLTFLQTVDDASFDDLVAELLRQQSPIGSERRSEFEAIVYAHPSSLDGSVSLDVIECGSRLCAADFRSAEGEILQSLIEDVMETDALVGQVLVGFRGSEIYSHGESYRLVFSHGADVTGVVIQRDSFSDSEGRGAED